MKLQNGTVNLHYEPPNQTQNLSGHASQHNDSLVQNNHAVAASYVPHSSFTENVNHGISDDHSSVSHNKEETTPEQISFPVLNLNLDPNNLSSPVETHLRPKRVILKPVKNRPPRSLL